MEAAIARYGALLAEFDARIVSMVNVELSRGAGAQDRDDRKGWILEVRVAGFPALPGVSRKTQSPHVFRVHKDSLFEALEEALAAAKLLRREKRAETDVSRSNLSAKRLPSSPVRAPAEGGEFDLPRCPERLLRLKDVLGILSISRSSWYKGIREGKFPAPRQLGPKFVFWPASAISEVVAVMKGRSSFPNGGADCLQGGIPGSERRVSAKATS